MMGRRWSPVQWVMGGETGGETGDCCAGVWLPLWEADYVYDR